MKLTFSTFVFSLALANVVVSSRALAADATAAQPKPKQALILPFAVANDAAATPGASGAACPKTPNPNNNLADTNPQKLIDTITAELEKKLAKKMDTRIGQPADEPATGTLVLAGCLTTIDPGNAVKRMAGMNLGASHLAAHVVVQLKTDDGLVAVKEFDATAEGSRKLPPLGVVGVATHAAAERKETLDADAKRLADEILKTLSKKSTN
jgi:Domain of unknown function (DUF4410)